MEIEQQIRSEYSITKKPIVLNLKTLSTSLNIVDVRILKQFYCPEPTPFVFKYLYQKFRKYGWKEHTIRNRLRRLAKMGLIKIVPRTNPLCILPMKEVEHQMKILVVAMLGKFDLKE
jgi:hypothetical protein